MSAAKRKQFKAAEAKRNQQDFLDSVQKTLPEMTDEQVFQLIKSLVEGQ